MTRLIDFTWGPANRGGHYDWPFLMALKQGFFVIMIQSCDAQG